MTSAYTHVLRVERLLYRLRMYKKRPKGGYRPLLDKIRNHLGKAEAMLQRSQQRDLEAKKKWVTIACENCLHPLLRVDPKGPIARQTITMKFFCMACDEYLRRKKKDRRLRNLVAE